MTEIVIMPCRIDADGAQRLLVSLQNDIANGRDLGPRHAQIRALGHSMERAGEELRSGLEYISVEVPSDDENL